MSRTLFVDDEPSVLRATPRAVYDMGNEWTMQLASSSAAALEELEKNAADVVVSDMRMPGVDGRQLPSEIRRTYRQTVYLILSGHADSSSVKRTAGIAHQYLAMPCESTAGQEGLTSRNEAFGLDIRSEA